MSGGTSGHNSNPQTTLTTNTKATNTLTTNSKEVDYNENIKNVIVFDAGSTGSRVHVFHFDASNQQLLLLGDDVKRTSPGLGEIKSGAKEAAKSLGVLLDYAKKRVHPKQ